MWVKGHIEISEDEFERLLKEYRDQWLIDYQPILKEEADAIHGSILLLRQQKAELKAKRDALKREVGELANRIDRLKIALSELGLTDREK